jgi:hypothetical protein
VENKGARKGVGSTGKKGRKMIGTMAIKAKRGIQRDRVGIRVLVGPLYSFFFCFYSCRDILWLEVYCND